ncbi:hypothetical protein [Tabrizicola sp.]|uniref:hypothetical protein n=1 Tax=Tabrizicola sp. TaxID=2005166 RepID=UPI003F406D0F
MVRHHELWFSARITAFDAAATGAPMFVTRTLASLSSKSCAAALSVVLPASAAIAEDYPFSGLFWPAAAEVSIENLDAHCALSFLEQRKNGEWFIYHVDLEEFRKSKAIKYFQLASGKCTYAAATKVESCTTIEDKSYPEGAGQVFLDVVTSISEDRVETMGFADFPALISAVVDGKVSESGLPQNYLRCPYPEEAVMSRVAPETTSASVEELDALRFPTDELLSSPEVKALVQALRTPGN